MNKKTLSEPLNAKNIKYRSTGQTNVGYITSSHAIHEANRAFDFDGWSSETTEMELVQNEQKAKKNNANVTLFYIGYVAKVKVTVGNIVREGFGFGQGIDADLGKAHESATKEAESDAMKRALRTFGDIFGLALYDKENANITDANEENYQTIDSDQLRHLNTMIDKVKKESAEKYKKELCTFYNLESLAFLTGKQYQTLINKINKAVENA